MGLYDKVVVIGGGIAGASITRLLAKRGINVELFEKSGQLCSGATWHAAGLVTRFGGSSKLKKIHVRALQLLTELREDHHIGLNTPGSIRLIEKGNDARMKEAEQHCNLAKLFDDPLYPTKIIDVNEIKQLHPLVDTDSIAFGVHTPYDGDIDPTSLTTVVAQLAKDHGAKFTLNTEVKSIDVNDDVTNGKKRFSITTSRGDVVEADAVVNAAGLWSRNITQLVAGHAEALGGMYHPAFVIEHQYAITESIPEVAKLRDEGHNGGRLPVLRDLKGSSYIRQEGTKMLIGPYEDECVVHTDWPLGPPSNWGMDLFPDKLDRIEENIMMAIDVLPVLGTVGLQTVLNGPTIWTGDSLARVGRSVLPGWYDFNSLTYGIAQSLALAEYLEHIMLEGEQPYGFDASDYFDPLRYGAWATDEYTVEKIQETYTHNNAIVYPFENRSGGRSGIPAQYPLHSVLKAHGAAFGPFGASGVEVPLCFVPAGSQLTDERVHNNREISSYSWEPYAEEEAAHVLKHVGLSYSSFSKLKVTGADSLSFLEKVTTAVIPKKPAAIPADMPARLTYATTPKGFVCTEFTLCRESDDGTDWYLVGSRDHARSDVTWLRTQARELGYDQLEIQDMSSKVCVLHLAGAKSKELIIALDERTHDLPFMHGRRLASFGGQEGIDVIVFRVSFSGEQGYELHFPSDKGPALHDMIWKHPKSIELELKHFGSAALNSLRIEKAFKLRADLDLAHYCEAGIEPFLSKKRQFLGKDPTVVPKRRSAIFKIETDSGNRWNIPGDCPVVDRDESVVGFTTTSAFGATTKATIALGYVYTNSDAEVPELEGLCVHAYGNRWPMEALAQPPAKMKGKD